MFFFKKKLTAPSETAQLDVQQEFANVALASVSDILGLDHAKSVLQKELKSDQASFDSKNRIIFATDADKGSLVKTILSALAGALEASFGREFAETKIAYAWYSFKAKHKQEPTILGQVIQLVPSGFLEEEKLRFLSKEALEKRVQEQTKELKSANDELEEKVRKRTQRLQELLEDKEKTEVILKKQKDDLVTANEELKQLDIAKSEFISVAAHQLRTPLSGIKWTLSLLVNGDLGPLTPDQKIYLIKTAEGNDRMIGLVNGLLSADRIRAGKFEYQLSPTQLPDLIESIISDLSPQAVQQGVVLEFKKEPALPVLNLDTEKIRGVFQNLIDNAIKYTRSGGKINVSIGKKGDKIEVEVKDNGIGVPEDQKKQLFERFFRARNVIKMHADGSGLGLFIARKIVEDHGGIMRFDSVENQGTTFFVELPITK